MAAVSPYQRFPIGTVIVTSEFVGGLPAPVRGVVYAQSVDGVSIIFPNSFHDSFTDAEIEEYGISPIPLRYQHLREYAFKGREQLDQDYEAGLFDAAFGIVEPTLAVV